MNLMGIVQALVILTLANTTPLIAKKLFGGRFSQPLDGGLLFFDGRPLFGASKTIRGIVLSLAVTGLAAPIIGLHPSTGAIMAGAAMIGDLSSSFLKRRLGRPTSSQALGLDQLPESFLPLLAGSETLSLSALDIIAALTLFFAGEILLSRLLYKAHWRDQPY